MIFNKRSKLSVIFILCVVVAASVLAYLKWRPDPYISRLRTEYVDDLISDMDRAKLTPLEYNVKRLVFEESLDVFLNQALNTEERKRIAPIIADKEVGFRNGIEQGIVSKSRAHRAYEKYERALAMGIYEMAKH